MEFWYRIGIVFIAVVLVSLLATALIKKRAKAYSLHVPYGPYEAVYKRILDIVFSSLALIILSPVFLITSILVRKKLGNPVLFSQERPGRIDVKTQKERIFKLYKFRSMTDARDENGELLPDEERLVPFGRKLRTSSIDELPELINIFKGEMSIIGPRPLLVRYLPYYSDVERHRHDVRPGLSGLAQINGRNLVGWDERLAYDVQYVNHITFCSDVAIVVKTVTNIFKGDGAVSNTYEVESDLDEERKAVKAGEN